MLSVPLLEEKSIDNYNFIYALSALYRLNPQKNSSTWNQLKGKLKDPIMEAVLLATQGPSYSNFTLAINLIQQQFDSTALNDAQLF